MESNLAWKPKLKNYPHFDAPISARLALKLATDPNYVKHYKFLPFLSFTSITKKFNSKKIKERVIRYGARKDAYIFSYYRKLLMDKYEPKLRELALDDCVIAYRKINYEIEGDERGKSNINFAQEAFSIIKKFGNCVAITLDISSFFESLDHNLIKDKWLRILDLDRLPDDHFRVFKNITDYRVVDFEKCYKRLGFLEQINSDGLTEVKFKFSRKDQPKQLCSDMKEFREKVAGEKGKFSSLIDRNPYMNPEVDMKHWGKSTNIEKRGIPQGSPISDVIANIYLLDFDIKMKNLIDKEGGIYRRYSDDILIIIPNDLESHSKFIDFAKSEIKNEGKFIKIKDSKTLITKFYKDGETLTFKTYDSKGKLLKKPFEYLGFTFNGSVPLLKSETVSRYYKRMKKGITAAIYKAKQDAKSNAYLDINEFINEAEIFHKFSRANPNWKDKRGHKKRNFLSYVNRSADIMMSEGIRKQLRNHKKKIRSLIKSGIEKTKI